MELHLIIGLPGSGKTYLGKKLLKSLENAVFFDDAFKQEDFKRIVDSLPKFKNIIISAPHFCVKRTKDGCVRKVTEACSKIGMSVVLHEYYFENNPEKCHSNVNYREDGREVSGMINSLSKVYHPIDPIKIWTKDEKTL